MSDPATADNAHNVGTTRIGRRQVLYDTALITEPDEALFEPHSSNVFSGDSEAIGRAAVVMHRYQGLDLVSKHYYRGGLMSRIRKDAYLGTSAERSRSFREWCMLNVMRRQGLPVPVPVAASFTPSGLFYRADLVTVMIPDVITLAEACASGDVDAATWRRIGEVLARFHEHNVYHADLNARNIMLDTEGSIHVLDFDKGCFRHIGDSWRNSNLARLKRSLLKFAERDPAFHFDDADWRSLLAGYSAS